MHARRESTTSAQLSRDLAKSARDYEAGSYLQAFLVAAIVSILVTRLFLALTWYPQLGGSGLHVAHLLWGGLLMLVALVLLLAFIGRHTKKLAALVGGVGFGLFIDEIGKFVTADNDYFFQPAIALIYTILIVLFLIFRSIGRRTLTDEELLANAADMVRETVIGGATESEIIRSIYLLDQSKAQGPVADGLRQAVIGAARAVDSRPSWLFGAAALAWRAYDAITRWRGFSRVMLGIFITESLLGIGVVVIMLIGVLASIAHPAVSVLLSRPEPAPLMTAFAASPIGLPGTIAAIIAGAASLSCAVIGIARLRSSRLQAYRWLERAVLISILFIQVILFWLDQLAAIGELIWNLLVLVSLRYAIRQEEARQDLRRLDAVATSAAEHATHFHEAPSAARELPPHSQ